MTPTEWIGQYENYIALIKNRRPNTVRGYVSDLKLLLKFSGVQDWRDFTEQQTVEYLKEMKKTQQDQSVARKIYCFRGFFKFLRKKGAIDVDPWEDIETHSINRKLPVLLSVQEMNKLLTCIRQPLSALVGIPNEEAFLTIRDRAMLETLYSAGLRVSELVGLDWGRIDFNKREVRVLGKGNKERTVPIGQKALEALAEYRPHYERQWEKKGRNRGAGVSLNVGYADQSADDSQDHRQMVRYGRREARQSARFPAQLRNSHAGRRRRHQGDSGHARACEHSDNGNLCEGRDSEGEKHAQQLASESLARFGSSSFDLLPYAVRSTYGQQKGGEPFGRPPFRRFRPSHHWENTPALRTRRV